MLQTNRWCHIAAVSGPGGMKLYFNGVLVGTDPFTGSLASIERRKGSFFGHSNWITDLEPGAVATDQDFHGQMDEMRVWRVVRTAEQIRETMFKHLTGKEPDLVSLWNFEAVENGLVKDAGPGQQDGKFIGNAKVVTAERPSAPEAASIERVLDLDGQGSYVRLPDGIFKDVGEATVEARVLWRSSEGYQRFFSFGELLNDMGAGQEPPGCLYFFSARGQNAVSRSRTDRILQLGQWYHLAAVSGPAGMKLFLNGRLVASHSSTNSLSATSGKQNVLGAAHAYPQGGIDPVTFNGMIDEFRVWRVARTEEHIRGTMTRKLQGGEPGLVGLWNFDDGTAKDASPNHHDGAMAGQARMVSTRLLFSGSTFAPPSVLSGKVSDEAGSPLFGAEVRLEQAGQLVAQAGTDASGSFRLAFVPNGQPYERVGTAGDKSLWRPALRWTAGEEQKADLVIKPHLVQGKVVALDSAPLESVVVQALWFGTNATASVSSATPPGSDAPRLQPGLLGQYFDIGVRSPTFPSVVGVKPKLIRVDRSVNFPAVTSFADVGLKENFSVRWTGRIRIAKPGQCTFYLLADDGGRLFIDERKVVDNGMDWRVEASGDAVLTAGDHDLTIELVQNGGAANVVFSWAGDGLPKEIVPESVLFHPFLQEVDVPLVALASPSTRALATNSVLTDKEGAFKFRHLKPGWYQVRVHDSRKYQYYGNESGKVFAVEPGQPVNGVNLGIRPFRKGAWRNYTYSQGLSDDRVFCSYVDPDGLVWFGTADGVSRFDGQEFSNLTKEDGLVYNRVRSIGRGGDGALWFGTERGVSRFHEGKFVPFAFQDELAHEDVRAIHRDNEGSLWFGTIGHGVFRHDGRDLVNFTVTNGLPGNEVWSVARGSDGKTWVDTRGYVSRFTGSNFVSVLTANLFDYQPVQAIETGGDGEVWLGTWGSGAFRYDGEKYQHLTDTDGLVSRWVSYMHRDRDGTVWFGTDAGVARYDGRTLVNYKTEDNFPIGRVSSITRDPRGILWVATDGNGVWRYDQNTFANFTAADGLPSSLVTANFAAPDGTVWFGCDSGVSRFDGETFVNLTSAHGLMGPYVAAIARARDGMMWFGTLGGGVGRANLYNGTTLSPRRSKAGR